MINMIQCWFPLQAAQPQGKTVAGMKNLFVDDLFGGGIEMEQRILARLIQVGSEDWNDVIFTRERIRWINDTQKGSYMEVSHQRRL